jgi:hypothetical protein
MRGPTRTIGPIPGNAMQRQKPESATAELRPRTHCPTAPQSAGLYVLKEFEIRADVQSMTRNDEPIYETVMREHNWDPERCEPLSLTTTLSVGRHVA